jgi:aminoglycoside phosphotransferase (APT) family kinase protein
VREWNADVEVDECLVRRLIDGQFPELAQASLRPFAEGWDNAVWLVDERWAFRFPRRTIAIPGVEREIAVLPALAPRLPVGIPAPVFAGRPALGYPWPFFGAALLPGVEAGDAALDDGARIRIAPVLARFLRVLHDTELDQDLPIDPNWRGDMPRRVEMTVDWLARLEREGLWRAPAAVSDLLAEAEALPATTRSVLCHGDLHFRHVLVDEQGTLTGVIDWGDLCRADPAIDLSLLWSFFPPEGRAAFLDAYGPLADDQLVRARLLAVNLCVVLALYGHQEGMAGVKREALEGLERTVA